MCLQVQFGENDRPIAVKGRNIARLLRRKVEPVVEPAAEPTVEPEPEQEQEVGCADQLVSPADCSSEPEPESKSEVVTRFLQPADAQRLRGEGPDPGAKSTVLSTRVE